MKCIENKSGETVGCICETRKKCPFKEEYDSFTGIFCNAVSVNPDWKNENVFYQYQVEGQSIAHNLATKTIYFHHRLDCM